MLKHFKLFILAFLLLTNYSFSQSLGDTQDNNYYNLVAKGYSFVESTTKESITMDKYKLGEQYVYCMYKDYGIGLLCFNVNFGFIIYEGKQKPVFLDIISNDIKQNCDLFNYAIQYNTTSQRFVGGYTYIISVSYADAGYYGKVIPAI